MDVNERFNEILLGLVEKDKTIVLDIANVDFISSTGFGILANTNGKLKQFDKELIVLMPTDNVKRVFDILDFKHVLPIFETNDELREYLK